MTIMPSESRSPQAPVHASRQGSSAVDRRDPVLPPFLMRQPLLDAEYRVLGHELRINSPSSVPAIPGAGSAQQNQDEMLMVSVLDLAYQEALGRKMTWLRLDSGSLGSMLLDKLPRTGMVIALSPVGLSAAHRVRCQALLAGGHDLAFDHNGAAIPGELADLSGLARYVRIDVADDDLNVLSDRLHRLRGMGRVRLVAQNVRNEASFQACRKLGFDLFQGDYLTALRPDAERGLDVSRLRIVTLLNQVIQHAEFSSIEAGFKLDAALSYKLLRFINSPGVGLRYPVRSIGHALLMLGHDQLYRWLSLLLFVHAQSNGRGQALLRHALVRARLVEILGEPRVAAELRGGLFIVGILSMLDVVLNIPLADAVAELNLAAPIVDALLHGRGVYAPYLAIARACEFGHGAVAGAAFAASGLSAEAVNNAHLAALAWAEQIDL